MQFNRIYRGVNEWIRKLCIAGECNGAVPARQWEYFLAGIPSSSPPQAAVRTEDELLLISNVSNPRHGKRHKTPFVSQLPSNRISRPRYTKLPQDTVWLTALLSGAILG